MHWCVRVCTVTRCPTETAPGEVLPAGATDFLEVSITVTVSNYITATPTNECSLPTVMVGFRLSGRRSGAEGKTSYVVTVRRESRMVSDVMGCWRATSGVRPEFLTSQSTSSWRSCLTQVDIQRRISSCQSVIVSR